MRPVFICLLALSLTACNSSGKKKNRISDDDTAKTEQPPAATIQPVKGTRADIPPGIRFTGSLKEVWSWKDRNGDNLLITTLTEPYADKEKNEFGEEGQSAELHASLFTRTEGEYVLAWKLDDKEKSCPFDITCDFVKDALTVTDLDANGLAEVTLLYRMACRSDVSPAEMQLVMYEGQNKYVLKGLTWYGSPEDKFEVTESTANLETLPGYKKTEEEFMKTWGRYESEKGFAGAPPAFLSYARKRWMMFVKEGNE